MHHGKFIGMAQSLAGGSPSNRGNDGPTHILVRTRQHIVFLPELLGSSLEINCNH